MRSAFLDIRFLVALIGGAIIAIGLFLFMHQLIANNQTAMNVPAQINLVNFVHVQREPEVHTKQRVAPPPPKPRDQPPPQAQVQTNPNRRVPTNQLPVNIEFDTSSMGGTGVYINPSNNGPATNAGGYAPLTPMVRFTPLYPPQAAVQGVTGQVNTCFTVEPDGSVASPHVQHASSPAARRLLSRAALQAIRQWKFFPKKVNGKPVASSGVCQVIQFKMQ